MPHRAPGSPGQPKQFLSGKPIRYYRPKGSPEVKHLIDEGFQAFNAGRLSEACQIFAEKMLAPENDTTIGLTVAGAMTPAGLGGCVIEMMDRGLVDFIISTGANLYHDLHYALNFTLRRGSPFVNDVELYEEGIIRIYDVLFPATVLLETDSYIRDFIVRSGLNEPIATSEFHYRLGRDLLERFPGCEEHSVVARAALAGVPLYTSSPGDSSIGMNIAYHELMNGSRFMIDPNKDVNEVCAIVLAGKQNGCVILGGGSPKNFYLQAQPTLVGGLRNPEGRQRLLHPDHDRPGRLGRPLGRDAGRSRELGQGQSRRSARHRRGVLRLDDRVPALLRIRDRVAQQPPHAQGAPAPARRGSSGSSPGTRKRCETSRRLKWERRSLKSEV